jgi:hypothetical protein
MKQDCHVKQNKLSSERQILHVFPHTRNLDLNVNGYNMNVNVRLFGELVRKGRRIEYDEGE